MQLTRDSWVFLLSCSGAPLFTYELVRHRLHLRWQLAAAWALFSLPIMASAGELLYNLFHFLYPPAQQGWNSLIPGNPVMDGLLVCWCVLRLTRPRAATEESGAGD